MLQSDVGREAEDIDLHRLREALTQCRLYQAASTVRRKFLSLVGNGMATAKARVRQVLLDGNLRESDSGLLDDWSG